MLCPLSIGKMFICLFDHSLGYFSSTILYGGGKMMISITAMPSILALSSADEIDFFFFFYEVRSLMKMKCPFDESLFDRNSKILDV